MHSLLNAHDCCPISNSRERNNFPSFFNHCAVQMCSALTAQEQIPTGSCYPQGVPSWFLIGGGGGGGSR